MSYVSIDLMFKRIFDVIMASFLLILLFPFLLLIAIMVKLSSEGPILFKQIRSGLNKKSFVMLKFRTMYFSRQYDDVCVSEKGKNTIIKSNHDPRVTLIGGILRRTSLDELPQLINVLKGEMSIVGPRPLPERMLMGMDEFYNKRCLVKPGITGLWQIRDRQHNTSAGYMESHDIEYINSRNLFLDLRILVSTIRVVILGKGAY